jgi:ABC-type transporter Mla MlaB component
MQASVRRGEAGTHLSLSGDLTEHFDLTPLLPELTGAIEVDLSGVRRINSAGVRQWIRFVSALAEGREVALLRCPASFIWQASMIGNFLGRATVRSFYVPYICPRCEGTRSVLVEVASLDVAGPKLPGARCDGCAEAMESDVVPEVFLGFLGA